MKTSLALPLVVALACGGALAQGTPQPAAPPTHEAAAAPHAAPAHPVHHASRARHGHTHTHTHTRARAHGHARHGAAAHAAHAAHHHAKRAAAAQAGGTRA